MDGTIAHPDTETLTSRLVEALAAATDTDPLDLEPPLYHVVDVDAVERLVESGALDVIEFEYAGYTVGVENDGTVSVDETGSDR